MQLAKAYTPPKMAKLCTMQDVKLLQHVPTILPSAGWSQQLHDLYRPGWARPTAQFVQKDSINILGWITFAEVQPSALQAFHLPGPLCLMSFVPARWKR